MPSLRIAIALACLIALPRLGQAQAYGISPEGNKGRIHTVVKGDTLWDITAEYLGTPWIWPSVWKENDAIQNPHLINPGDIIWIAEGEMRKLTPEEAEAFMRNALPEDERAAEPPPPPAAPQVPPPPLEPKRPTDPFAALDSSDSSVERYVELPDVHRYSFVSPEEYAKGSGAVMGTHRPNYWSGQHQRTIVSVGEGETHVGDVFTIFRVRRRLLHPDNSELLGYLIEVLGIGEVTEVDREASYVKITRSYAEIQPGDRVTPFIEEPQRIREVFSSDPADGQIVAYQPYRLRAGGRDLVVLDVGTERGVVEGRRFDLYRAGREVRDPHSDSLIMVPDDVIGEAFVIKASPKASLALVTDANTDLILGDRFRTHR